MNTKNLKEKINDVKKAFSDFSDLLPDSGLTSITIRDYGNVIDELENVYAVIRNLEKIKNSEIVSCALDILDEKPYGSENIKDWHKINMEYCDSSELDGDGCQTEYYEDRETGRTFSLEFTLDDARRFGTWIETTEKETE